VNKYRVVASTGRAFFDGIYYGSDPEDVYNSLSRKLGGVIRVFRCTFLEPEPTYLVFIGEGDLS
jgi:hypothetical protein